MCVQIASAVFIKPPLATCGLTEQQAQARLTGDIDIFVSKFKPMKNTLSGRDEKTFMKIIVKVDTDEVRLHLLPWTLKLCLVVSCKVVLTAHGCLSSLVCVCATYANHGQDPDDEVNTGRLITIKKSSCLSALSLHCCSMLQS